MQNEAKKHKTNENTHTMRQHTNKLLDFKQRSNGGSSVCAQFFLFPLFSLLPQKATNYN